MSFHKLIVTGNLGKDPEMRYTPGGAAVTNFNVAVSNKYTATSGERVEETIWLRVACWGKLAESTNQYLRKGSKVLVEGQLKGDVNGNPKTFEGSQGQTLTSFEVTAQRVEFLDSAQNNGSSQDEDEVPF